MDLELWRRTDADGSQEDSIALYKRSNSGEIIGIKLGGLWYQDLSEANRAGWEKVCIFTGVPV